ncbi:hypothetical protein BC827DRAFT_466548 [Russula dissimulans]|nr:hypothetical protein BC827DRAFT_466548 [Russula dissimulans]
MLCGPIMQGNDQMLGLPVNRINIIGLAVANAIPRSPDLSFGDSVKERCQSFHEGVFYTAMALIDSGFGLSRTFCSESPEVEREADGHQSFPISSGVSGQILNLRFPNHHPWSIDKDRVVPLRRGKARICI